MTHLVVHNYLARDKEFSIKNSVLGMPPGDYKVVGKEGGARSFEFGTFSSTRVENKATGVEYRIPTGNAQAMGLLSRDAADFTICPHCLGSTYKTETLPGGKKLATRPLEKCPECKGTGKAGAKDLGSGMRPEIIEISKENSKIIGKPAGFYFDDGGKMTGPFKLRSMAVEASRKNPPPLDLGRAALRKPVPAKAKPIGRDYLQGYKTYMGKITLGNGSTIQANTMAQSRAEARTYFMSHYGTTARVDDVREVATTAPVSKRA